MAGIIDIYNMALSHTGTADTVADLNEASRQRRACTRFYETDRDTVLSEVDWRFATRSVVLADIGSPPTNWQYRYRYPNDCMRIIRITVPGRRYPQQREEIPYEVQWEDSGRCIVTDQPDAELIYVSRVEEAERYPSNFVEALAVKLASSICMPLVNDMSMKTNLLQLYTIVKQDAQAQSFNEARDSGPQPSEYEMAFGGLRGDRYGRDC